MRDNSRAGRRPMVWIIGAAVVGLVFGWEIRHRFFERKVLKTAREMGIL